MREIRQQVGTVGETKFKGDMKAIIYRDKETKRIVRDGGDDYELLKSRGKTDEDIDALVEYELDYLGEVNYDGD